MKVESDEAALAFAVFYHQFLTKACPLDRAMKIMNLAVACEQGSFESYPASAAALTFAPARRKTSPL
jgi:hypothetical protein